MSELPKSVATYITDELGHPLTRVAAHRHVNGDEPKYAVLMRDEDRYWLVVFVGRYEPIRQLGDYEEAYDANARLASWECLYDSEDWDGTLGQFKSAKYGQF